jgi:hypothetical protein
LISLHSKRFDIIQNCFQANKPAYLISSTPSPIDTEDDQRQNDCENKKKKLKWDKEKEKDQQGGKDLGALIRNPNTNKDWICTRNYRLIFNKGVNRSTPPFNDSGITACNKWHLQGHCFEKCERKATHKDFPNDTFKSAYSKWVKEVKDKSHHKAS